MAVTLAAAATLPQETGRLNLQYADETEFIFSRLQDTVFVTGSVVFETESGMIYCDSAMWLKGRLVILHGRVIIDEADYRLAADWVRYDLKTSEATARGEYVELWSRPDSLMAVGTQAFYDRSRRFFYMEDRPTVYFNYPDSARMIEVIGDNLEYDAVRQVAECEGQVRINSQEFASTSGCAVMHPQAHTLDLFDQPLVTRRKSQITGRFIAVDTDGKSVRRVDVVDSAEAEFVEPTDTTETYFDRSHLTGKRIILDFEDGDLRLVTCRGQAYSWYKPADLPGHEAVANTVSGDSILLTVEDEHLLQVEVVGGAVGKYLSTTTTRQDTTLQVKTDTIDYDAHYIKYSLVDSMITLRSGASATAGAVSLEAHSIRLDTRQDIIEAFSGQAGHDTAARDNMFVRDLQPNNVPVVLKDKTQNLLGDYLKYSIDTEKGRIVTSKSQYETGFYYGHDLYREKKNIYYLDACRYTTCDGTEPHFHFYSSNLKLIEDDKLLARPVVFYLGRIPLLAIPYYVFPLKKGRHSGILPFTIGNIERGERFIRNVGYYWAASEYWDWQGALDYFEDRSRVNFFSRVNYNKRYAFDGSVSGNWGRETSLTSDSREYEKSRWTLQASHNHELAPSFKVSATGLVQSDPEFYQDYSTDLEQRLNRVIRSKLNFTKRFGKSVTLSGQVTHDDQLDKEARTDQLPSLSLTVPAIHPLGSGSSGTGGQTERHWYQELISTYRPKFLNYSSRVMRVERVDTTITDIDTIIAGDPLDTLYDTTLQIDSVRYRSRKEYARFDHSLNVSFPTKVARYIVFNPTFNYYENWVKIFPTDQSDAVGIDASEVYRTYKYDAGASLQTTIYGTVYPNVFGLLGLRQAITPNVGYSFTPEIDRHPQVSSYAGAGARSARRSQSLSLTLAHLYQAKLRKGEGERSLELVSIKHGLNYDFESETRKLSEMSTSYTSNVLPSVRFYGDMVHSFYPNDTADEPAWKHTRMLSFSFNASVNLRGRNFLFDEPVESLPRGADSASQLATAPRSAGAAASGGWNLSASYGFSESSRGTASYQKNSFLRMTLNFNLTPTTRVTYSQAYDFQRARTVTSHVSIQKTIHCWSGDFYWVPTGSTKGWGFRLYVTALPAVKIDNSQSSLNSSYFQGLR